MAVLGSSNELFNFGSWISRQFFMAVFMVITIFCQTLVFAKKKSPKKVIKIFIFLHIFKALYWKSLPAWCRRPVTLVRFELRRRGMLELIPCEESEIGVANWSSVVVISVGAFWQRPLKIRFEIFQNLSKIGPNMVWNSYKIDIWGHLGTYFHARAGWHQHLTEKYLNT